MRQIVLDTETTGIGHESGHRIIEIGCVEIIDRKLTGNHYHTYLNPQRLVDEGAFRVHGISDAFLKDKPFFNDVADDFITFINDSELIIHNAAFDVGFINAELSRIKWPNQLKTYCTVFDTLLMARKKHPGQRVSLDALCKRYAIDNSNRQLHGALLDAEILALVYLAMTGGQTNLFENELTPAEKNNSRNKTTQQALTSSSPVIYATPEEVFLHDEFVEFLLN